MLNLLCSSKNPIITQYYTLLSLWRPYPCSSSSMAEIHSLLTAMDRLWFHHIILLCEPISIICSKSMVNSPISSPSPTSSTDNSQLVEDKPSTNSPEDSVSQDDCNNEVEEGKTAVSETERETSENLNQIAKKSKSQSPTRGLHRPCRSLNYYDDINKCLKLPRTLSCRTPYDHLEQQEVQGFMDLGFQFEKGQLTPRTMSVIPGLQRLGGGLESTFNETNYITSSFEGKEGEKEEEKRVVVRPYLSEAWEVKKPNSPLLRLRMARVNTKEDMKKCLKLWAKTVATSIHLDR